MTAADSPLEYLMTAADQVLYCAKQQGKNCVIAAEISEN